MPCNIAAPTFALADSLMLDEAHAVFQAGSKTIVVGEQGEEGFCIGIDDWQSLIKEANTVAIRIQGKQNSKWVEYDAFNIYISQDSIDPYLAYRLIEPGYEQWGKMGIYQRNLETYEEEAIITNSQTNGGCMNCHSFCQQNPEKMLFHLRVDFGGTYISNSEKSPLTFSHLTPSPSFVYPSWHPSGKYVAFSNNNTKQLFHTTDVNRIEVFDFSSDIIVYDVETGDILSCPQLHSSSAFETFPSWSPDGKTLYFCSADSVLMPDEYEKVKYALCSIGFDASTRTFSETVDTLYNEGRSVSFPRVSPDGKHLIYTLADYGTFSIWHKDAELYMIDLQSSEASQPHKLMKETGKRASYHSWSSNSRWLIYSSRRDDGLYTRPYIIHIDEQGNCTKPFTLPQKDASFYTYRTKSFNVPELIKGKVSINKEALSSLLK